MTSMLMGRFVQIPNAKLPAGMPKNASVFVRGNNDVGQPADTNTAKFFYVSVGPKNFGPFPMGANKAG
jgi:hypothetical protein